MDRVMIKTMNTEIFRLICLLCYRARWHVLINKVGMNIFFRLLYFAQSTVDILSHLHALHVRYDTFLAACLQGILVVNSLLFSFQLNNWNQQTNTSLKIIALGCFWQIMCHFNNSINYEFTCTKHLGELFQDGIMVYIYNV